MEVAQTVLAERVEREIAPDLHRPYADGGAASIGVRKLSGPR